MIEVENGIPNPRVEEAVLFPFDNTSIPFAAGLRMHLVDGKQRGRPPVVLGPGEPGAPDDRRTRFYGTVIPIEDALHMWYMGSGSVDGPREYRACYAISRDGVHWVRPALGLVEYNGSRANNLIDFREGRAGLAAFPILYEPDDPDPDRRFKVAFECGEYQAKVSVAFSPDGLRWTESPHNPGGAGMEMTGLIRFNGCYYINGHGGFHFGVARNLITYASYDFEHWTQASCLGFYRDRLPIQEMADIRTRSTGGEQVHLGAGLWDRGNVILGVYDIWHGPESGDRLQVTMDLGLLISHDALHYREPIPDFRFVPGYEEAGGTGTLKPEEGLPPMMLTAALSHGQGMCNWGDETMLWYEAWVDGGIRLARWERDRLGYFRAWNPEEYGGRLRADQAAMDRHCITCPIRVHGPGARVYANVDGISQYSELSVEVLDGQFRPLPGYSGDASIPLTEPGLRQPVVWKDRDTVGEIDGPFRLRVKFGGVRREDTRLYALYVA
ncbi:MAG: hypothetical protein CL878_15110 [Dehalococcoidia bacterium]|nr:hypothetical protein [Dehalococcoidia bacterium]